MFLQCCDVSGSAVNFFDMLGCVPVVLRCYFLPSLPSHLCVYDFLQCRDVSSSGVTFLIYWDVFLQCHAVIFHCHCLFICVYEVFTVS
jgi:hypothetical protein